MIYTEGDSGLYYTHLSDGTKIKVCGYDDNEPTRYAGSLVYNNGTFESASFGGGRIVGTNDGANSEVHYFLTDHRECPERIGRTAPLRHERNAEPTIHLSRWRNRVVLDRNKKQSWGDYGL